MASEVWSIDHGDVIMIRSQQIRGREEFASLASGLLSPPVASPLKAVRDPDAAGGVREIHPCPKSVQKLPHMTFSASGLRRFVSKLAYPVSVLGKDTPTAVLFADRAKLERLIDAGAVWGWGTGSKLRGVRLCDPPRKALGPQLATPMEVRNLPCCGDVAKAFTIADGPWRQWRNNPPPRPRFNQNTVNHGN